MGLFKLWEKTTWIHSNLFLTILYSFEGCLSDSMCENSQIKTWKCNHRGLVVERWSKKRRVPGSNPAAAKVTNLFFFTICVAPSLNNTENGAPVQSKKVIGSSPTHRVKHIESGTSFKSVKVCLHIHAYCGFPERSLQAAQNIS